jgi:cytochrome P450
MARPFVEWSDRMLLGGSDPQYAEDRSDPRYRSFPFGSPAGEEVFEYAAALAAQRRADPRDDVITRLLTGQEGEEPLTDVEFRNFIAMLVIAGQEANRHVLSTALQLLLQHPSAAIDLAEHPGLIDTAVDEIIRWASPVYHFRRTATEALEVAGVDIPAGAKVTLWFASANFDDAQFEDPFTFDIRRQPNNHVAFGKGPHTCLGLHLGKLQAKVTIQELLPHLHRLHQAGAATRLQSNLINGLKTLPVEVA